MEDITAIPPVGRAGEGSTNAFQANSHNFMLRVQGAIGPKTLTGYGTEGRVLVAFSIGNDGALTTAHIARSSGVNDLDRAALQIVGRAVFPVPPPGMSVIQRTYVSAFTFS